MKKNNIYNQKSIHFVGIGGIGMSGIAELMLSLGYKIQGSDISINNNIKRLKKKNIKIFLGHKSKNIINCQAIVYSSAIKNNNCEILEAKKKSIPIVSRADMLAELMRNKNSIAIAGSHGKTTTTSLVGSILQMSKKDPTIVNGGIINSYSSNHRYGSGNWMVVEADESDGSFLRLPHEINVITNIDEEHLDYYKNFNNLILAFEKFATNIPFYGASIICLDNKQSKKLAQRIKTRRVITYGINNNNADLNIVNIYYKNNQSFFSIKIKANKFKKYNRDYVFKLNLLGSHNVLNATASICVGFFLNISINNIRRSLISFQGVKRRFTYIGKINRAHIYDDYAHHPTEIKATLEIAKIIAKNKIIIVFQPHRFSRTKSLYNDFIKVFRKADYLFITDIYAAGERKNKIINSSKLVRDMRQSGFSHAYYLNNFKKLKVNLLPFVDSENIIIFMGAGSISKHANNFFEKINV